MRPDSRLPQHFETTEVLSKFVIQHLLKSAGSESVGSDMIIAHNRPTHRPIFEVCSKNSDRFSSPRAYLPDGGPVEAGRAGGVELKVILVPLSFAAGRPAA